MARIDRLCQRSPPHSAAFEVVGNQRVEASTVSDYVNIKPGQTYSAADLDEAVKRLFSTGLFSDVRIRQSGSTLIIEVDELSVINQVIFQGNKKIKDVALSAQVQSKAARCAGREPD